MNAEPLKVQLRPGGTVALEGPWPEKMLLDPAVAEKAEGIVAIVFDDVLISLSNGSARYVRQHTRQDGTWVCSLLSCRGGGT